MNDALAAIRTRNTATSQREQARPDQVVNHAGGYVFEVAGEDRIKRFLTLGTDGGTFYAKENQHTKENAAFVIDFAKNHGVRLTQLLLDISEKGRAPRQNPTLFALAAVFAFGDAEAKISAREVFTRIVRTGTHMFIFVKYAEQFRGWGRGLKKAVGSWYTDKDVRDLSYQMIKYRQREGWTHRDVLRSAHVGWKTPVADADKRALFDWACGRSGGVFRGGDGIAVLPEWARPYELIRELSKLPVDNAKKSIYADVIREYPGLPWEALPDIAVTYAETWEALIDQGMPITALIRQLPRLTNLGLTKGKTLGKIVAQLTDEDKLRHGRVHPVKLLYALKTYSLGRSSGQGDNSWTPSQGIVDALDQSFYTSFGTIEPAGKRTLLALDCSSSMTWPENMCGVIQAREGAAAMAMATMASEPHTEVVGFSCGTFATVYQTRSYYKTGIERLALSPRRRLDDNIATVAGANAGGTDCALPMVWAKDNKLEFDTFVIYTDNETHSGIIQPFEALRQYRQSSGIDAKLIVVGMSSTNFTIADPKDPGMLDVAGFDSDTPNIISGFSRGDYS